jgi:hypothetical protein
LADTRIHRQQAHAAVSFRVPDLEILWPAMQAARLAASHLQHCLMPLSCWVIHRKVGFMKQQLALIADNSHRCHQLPPLCTMLNPGQHLHIPNKRRRVAHVDVAANRYPQAGINRTVLSQPHGAEQQRQGYCLPYTAYVGSAAGLRQKYRPQRDTSPSQFCKSRSPPSYASCDSVAFAAAPCLRKCGVLRISQSIWVACRSQQKRSGPHIFRWDQSTTAATWPPGAACCSPCQHRAT